MEGLVSLFVKSVFIENLALSFFFGDVYIHRCIQKDLHSYWLGNSGNGRPSDYCPCK